MPSLRTPRRLGQPVRGGYAAPGLGTISARQIVTLRLIRSRNLQSGPVNEDGDALGRSRKMGQPPGELVVREVHAIVSIVQDYPDRPLPVNCRAGTILDFLKV